MRGVCKIFTVMCVLGASVTYAQELKIQPTPSTVWLDFRAPQNPAIARREFPTWLDRVEIDTQENAQGLIKKTTVRIRFLRLEGINDELLFRLYFDDTRKPVLTAWNEIGTRIFEPKEFGQGLGLPTSETITLPMSSVDYLDIEVPGDGSNLHGVLLSSVEKVETRKALDFNPVPQLADPFDNSSATSPNENDMLLFGRVKASLGSEPVTLSAANNHSTIFEFELSTPPLLAVLTFEILNADIASPPQIITNEKQLGPATIILPDLADPAFEGSVQPLKPDVTFHYSGWLKCQKVLPGSALRSGSNRVQFQTSQLDSEPVAIRAVEVQLKYSTNANAQ